MPQSATEIHGSMLRVARRLHRTVEEYQALAIENAQAQHQAKQAQAKAYLEVEGTVDHRRALVEIQCADVNLSARIAEAQEFAARKLLDTLRAELSALQSIASAYRAEAELVGRGPQTTP